MRVWIEKAVEEENWQALVDSDTGDVSVELRAAALKIIELKQRDLKLSALEGAGVDNWEGYDYAMEELWKELG